MPQNEEENQVIETVDIPTEISEEMDTSKIFSESSTEEEAFEDVRVAAIDQTEDVQHLLLQNQKKVEHDANEKQLNQEEWAHLTIEKPVPPTQFNQFPPYFYAGFWMRAWAYLVDLMCVVFIRNIMISVISFIVVPNSLFNSGISVLIYLSYFILLTKLNQGQTLGKMIFGLRVVCFNEKELSWPTVIIREGACRFIFQVSFLSVLYIVAAFTPKKQHISDFISDTSVLTLNQLKAYQGLEA